MPVKPYYNKSNISPYYDRRPPLTKFAPSPSFNNKNANQFSILLEKTNSEGAFKIDLSEQTTNQMMNKLVMDILVLMILVKASSQK
jgi:hypothetical protein